MKKMLLVLGVAVAALTSCTSDEVVEMNQDNLIKFESFVNKGTRAVAEVTSLSGFYVFGGYNGNNVFNNTSIAANGVTNKNWVLEQTYNFAAYADGNNGKIETTGDASTVAFAEKKLTISNYTVDDSKDLVAVVTSDIASGNGGNDVDLTFKHLLSQVKFQFVNTSDYYMEVTDITFTAQSKGKCTVTNSGATWGNWSGPKIYTYTGTSTYVAPKNKNNDSYYEYSPKYQMVLPQTVSTIQAAFTINFYEKITENDYVLVESIDYSPTLTGTPANGDDDNVTEWQPSYKYNYKAFFPANPTQIKFSASVAGWEDDVDVDDNLTDNKDIKF